MRRARRSAGLRVQLAPIERDLDAVIGVVADRLVEAEPGEFGPRRIGVA